MYSTNIFYFRNLFIVSTISTFIYLLINYNNIETLSYYLELTFYLITGIEILILIFSLLYYKTKPFESINITDKTKDITLLVAFGGSSLETKFDTLTKLIENSLHVFNATNIIICYNYKNEINDKVIDFLKQFPIRYVSIPVPNKSYAIAWTSLHYVYTKYVMIIDDDVFIPQNINIPIQNINIPIECTNDVWGYMLCAEKPSHDIGLFSKYLIYCQDVEYRFAGFIKQLQGFFHKSTVMTHHGAISLYKKDVFDTIMSEHDCVFDGEDYLMGLLCYNNNKKISIVPEQYISTIVPNTLKSFALQRIISWDYVILKFIKHNLLILFKFELKNILIKLVAFYHLWTVFQDFVRIPNIILLTLYTKSLLWVSLYIGISFFIKSFCILMLLYIKNIFNSNEIPLKNGIILIIIYPIYTILTTIFRLLGQLRYLVYFDRRIQNDVLFKHRPHFPNKDDFD